MSKKYFSASWQTAERASKNPCFQSEAVQGYREWLKTLGAIDTSGTFAQRWSLFVAKIQAIITNIKDWLRKLKTGDLL